MSAAESAQESASALPERISSFLESFKQLVTRKGKAMLQVILKAAYIWPEGRIELEFR